METPRLQVVFTLFNSEGATVMNGDAEISFPASRAVVQDLSSEHTAAGMVSIRGDIAELSFPLLNGWKPEYGFLKIRPGDEVHIYLGVSRDDLAKYEDRSVIAYDPNQRAAVIHKPLRKAA